MTAPVIQMPSLGEQLAPLLRALEVQRQTGMQQQQLDLQRQQVEQQGIAQRTSQRNAAQDRFLDLMKTIGPTVLDDPQVQQQITEAGLTPQGIKGAFQQQQKAEVGAKKQQETEQLAQVEAALQGLPDNLRRITISAAKLAPTLGKEGASMFFREGISRLSTAKPEEIAALKARFPDFFAEGVPVEEAVKASVEASIQIAQAKQGLGPAAESALRRQLLQLRIDLLKMDKDLKGQDKDKRLQAALAFQRQVQPIITDIITMGVMGLTGKTLSERVEAIWGPEVRRIFDSLPQTISRAGGLTPEPE